jgi:hypothetical protein
VHGVVCGRETGGSAVMGLEDPICGLGGTTTTCARAAVAKANVSTVANPANHALGENVAVMAVSFRGHPKDAAQYTPRNLHILGKK